jgi:hypothetical protein
VIAPAEPLDVDVEAAPLEALHADLLQVQIPAGSRLHGVEIFELRLPAQASIALIVRDGKGFVPSPTTPLRTADRLLIVASAAVREQTERRLRAVSRAGKLAGWFGEHGRLPGRPVMPARRDGQVTNPGGCLALPFRSEARAFGTPPSIWSRNVIARSEFSYIAEIDPDSVLSCPPRAGMPTARDMGWTAWATTNEPTYRTGFRAPPGREPGPGR